MPTIFLEFSRDQQIKNSKCLKVIVICDSLMRQTISHLAQAFKFPALAQHLTVNHTKTRGVRVGKPSDAPNFPLSVSTSNASCSECHRLSQEKGIFFSQPHPTGKSAYAGVPAYHRS